MTTVPDFDTMTPDAIADWVSNNNISELLRLAKPAPAGVVADSPQDAPMKVTTVRFPEDVLAELDDAAGNDKEGRAGVVRTAVEEFLAKRRKAS